MDQNVAAGGQQRKGLSPLAWVAIGCGGLLVMAVVVTIVVGMFIAKKARDVVAEYEDNPAMAAAVLAVKLNPEVELVEADSDEGTLTVRNTRTGEVVTLDLADVEQGRFSFSSDEGTAEFRAGGGGTGDLPSWVPIYPGTSTEGGFSMQSDQGGLSGAFSAETGDSVDEVVAFYEARLRQDGFDVTKTSYSTGVTTGATLLGTDESTGRNVHLGVTREGATTSLAVTYGTEE